jgi:hypothetical protein
MSKKTQENVVALVFIAAVFCIAGIWLSETTAAAKCAMTSLLFVALVIAVVIAGRDKRL